MYNPDDVVIISGVRTPIGKFQGSLSELSAPKLGAIVVREAVKRAGIGPEPGERMHHGERGLRGARAKSCTTSCDLWRTSAAGRRDDHQQSLRIGAEGGCSRCAGHSNREQRSRSGGRDGVDDERALLASPGAQGLSARQRADRRLGGARRSLGYLTTTTTWATPGRMWRRSITSPARIRMSMR